MRLLRTEIDGVRFSANGGTLVTIDAKDGPFDAVIWDPRLVANRVHVWDVQPTRAWLWAIGSALALGVVSLLLRQWRLKRKTAA